MSSFNLTEISPNIISESSEHVLIAYCKLDSSNNQSITQDLLEQVINSWKGCLTIVPIQALSNSPSENSLRQPQISALFEILAHLSSHEQSDATVVMPTGTGKTETMLAAVCGFPVTKGLIVVPTDSLRKQTVKKFLTLGMLKSLNAIKQDTLNPIVALIEGGINTSEELGLALKANIIITTPQSLSQASTEFQSLLFDSCTHLFVDEAHHVQARTWDTIKKAFKNKPVVQFTATPFREDRQKVGGKIIYNYPMSMAQKAGFFRSISFKSVYEVSDIDGDNRVAEMAIAQLREDLKNGLDHILMARCGSQKRADQIGVIYSDKGANLNPIVIHSGVKQQKRKLEAILRKEHRIIICVDMLGEGFDLPELKICALHDIHKSLAITLQFAGRFVRDRSDLGNPTFVANICDHKVEGVLKDLYLEDPDWNKILQRTSETSIQSEVELQEIIENSIKIGTEVPIENFNPAVSALVYSVDSADIINIDINKIPIEKNEELVSSIQVPTSNLLILVTKVEIKTKWALQSDFSQSEWRLLILFYDPNQNLLFLHDSSKTGIRKRLVENVSIGSQLLKGDQVFRSFGEIDRLVLQNAGLNKGQRGPLRYVMYTGIDIESAINDLAQGSSYKSNFFGKGYDKGNKVNIGCSYKGRIWSMNSAPIQDWMDWCRQIGQKLNNQDIDPNKILDKVLRTKVISTLPQLVPIGIDWPDYFFEYGFSAITLRCQGNSFFLYEASLDITTHIAGTITFSLKMDEYNANYEYHINDAGYSVSKVAGDNIIIKIRSSEMPLERYFSEESSPSLFFEDGTKLFETLHVIRPEGFVLPQYTQTFLDSRVWTVDIRKESQNAEKNPDTIQYAVIQELKQNKYWIIFDDDGANEIADIIAFRDEGAILAVEFYHLKYSSHDNPGARISDFYEVCGQVIKGCKWVGEFEKIVKRLKTRERSRVNGAGGTRIELGEYRDFDLLSQHAGRLQKEYRFFIVQPGLNTKNVSNDILSLLGAVDLYVKETTGNSLTVIGS